MSTLIVGVATGAVYALLAMGYTIVYRATRVVNFTSGTYVVLGGLGTYWFHSQAHIAYPAAIVLGVLLAGAFAAVFWVLIVIPLWRRESADYVILLATVLGAAIASPLTEKTLSPQAQTLPAWIPGFTLDVSGSRISGQYVFVLAMSLILLITVTLMLQRSTIGRQLRACAASREMSRLLGIHPELIGGVAMVAMGLIGGLGGAMITPASTMQPDSGLTYAVFAFVAAVFGGLGNISGAFFGGLVLGVAQAFVDRYYTASYDSLIVFGILTLILLIRPDGLIGRTAAAR
jgi:branched-chain amino acid transport system permease protein